MPLAEAAAMRLYRLARSLPITAIALAAISNGCALPQVHPRMSADFAAGATSVRTVAVLPVDLSVQIAGQPAGSPQTVQLNAATLDGVHRALGAALTRRGYQVTALIEPNGASIDPRGGGWRVLIHPKDLAGLRFEIHQRTAPFAAGPGLIETRVSADLTRYLGKNTGADATLYARGWAYVDPASGGRTALKIVLGVLIVLVIVGIVVALAASKGKSGSGVGRLLAGGGRSVALGAAAAGRVAIRTAPYVIAAAAHAGWHEQQLRCYTCPPPPPPPPPPPTTSLAPPEEPGPVEIDGLAEPRPAPPVAVRPAAAAVPRAPAPPIPAPPPPTLVLRSGPPPTDHEVGLAISLIHNGSGRVLWHASQRFPVKARGGDEIDSLVEHFLKELPPAR